MPSECGELLSAINTRGATPRTPGGGAGAWEGQIPPRPRLHRTLLPALRDEARLLLAALADARLALLLALLAGLLALAAQAPLSYRLEIGQEDGPGADLPLIAGFHTPERDANGDFRWTRGEAAVLLPGVGQRPLLVELRLFPVSEEMARGGPQSFAIETGGGRLVEAPVRHGGGRYRVLLPPPADGSGDQRLALVSDTFTPMSDVRALGLLVDSLAARGVGGLALPAWRGGLAWLGALALCWAAVRRLGFTSRAGALLLLPLPLLVGLAALLDPPRAALGGAPALAASALGLGLALALVAAPAALAALGAALAAIGVGAGGEISLAGALLLLGGLLRPAIARGYGRLAPPIPAAAWRWLCLIALAVFVTRYGGKIYPDSMPGDIGFHVNRFADAARGTVLLLSRNRGVDFPYPPALYLLLAPLTLLGAGRGALLQLGGALLDALSPPLVYAIAARSGLARSQGVALLAAATYALSGAGQMPTWWNFSTHIFAQFAHLLLVAAVVTVWAIPDAAERAAGARREGDPPVAPSSSRPILQGLSYNGWAGWLAGLALIQCLVYLGHFGFWVNTTLLGGLWLAAWLPATRGDRAGRRRWWLAAGCFVAAELLAALLFYSGYAGLFFEQARLTLGGGLTELAGRAPVSRDILARTLWDGLVAHFGVLPVPLALCGLLAAASGAREARSPSRPAALTLALMAGTFAIGVFFAALPFVTGSTLATRWLMFSAWAIAVGAAAAAGRLWRRGAAGRLLVIASYGFTLWVSASMWLGALAWRLRPPEPF